MYNVSAAWRTALLEEGTIHHIKGVITDKNGVETDIQNKIADNSVRIEKQCTADSDSFAIGQIYTGTVELTLLEASALRRDNLKGGTVSLQFGVVVGNNTIPTWIPLGVWNITDPQRGSQDSIIIKGEDNTCKLDVPIQDDTVGFIKMQARMNMITELTGVGFAQTLSELSAIAGIDLSANAVHGTSFCATCRAELNAMAAFIGGIAYIDREGRIAFRKIGDNIGTAATELIIPAAKRFNADLSEYNLRVAKAAMTFRGDLTITDAAEGTAANTELIVDITGNPYSQKLNETDRLDILNRIRDNLASAGVWVPGQIDYYGDPTIDLGDVLTLSGGVNGETSGTPNTCQFLVTGIVWQFRGPQTLISAGAGAASAASTGSSAGSSSGGGNSIIIQQATIGAVDIDFYRDSFTSLVEIGEVMLAAANDTVGIVQLMVQIQGTTAAENEFRILRDGIMQTVYSCDTTALDQKRTVNLTAVLDFTEGIHIISVEAKGSASILRAVGTVYGQGVQAFAGNPTFDSDYNYSNSTITKYNGSDDMPRIPAQLGGSDVDTIGGGSFAGSDVEYAYIPDGVEEIK